MRILALDPATNAGWAVGEARGPVINCGTKVLATKSEITAFRKIRMDRRLDPRAYTFYKFLKETHEWARLDWIIFEDVQFASTSLQAHLWATWRAVIWIFAAENGLQVECLDTSKLKLFASGHGGATKDGMAAALVRKDPEFTFGPEKQVHFAGHENNFFLTDDAVDAVHLLKWAQTILANTRPK